MKINVDAALTKGNDIGTAAAVVRDGSGLFLGASVVVSQGITDPEPIEVLACREGLALAADLGFRKIRIASDCLSLVKNIQGDGMGAYGQIVKEIKRGESAVSFKSWVRRRLVEEERYRIRGNVGDQWSDLQGHFAGDRVFKLPNPMYFLSHSRIAVRNEEDGGGGGDAVLGCGVHHGAVPVLCPLAGAGEAPRRAQEPGNPRPEPSFPYGNLAEMMRQQSSAAQAAIISKTTAAAGDGDDHQRRGIVHDYRPAVFPFYDKWRNQYGPVFSYSIGNMVFLHASRCDVVRDLSLCVSASELGKSSYMKATHRPLFGDGILKSSGATWARQRKLLAPEFFPDKVRAMVGLMVASATSLLVNSWQHRLDDATASNNNNGGVVELKVDDDIRAYSADVISRTCFGSSSVMNNSKGERIFAVIRELQKAVAKPNLLAEMTGLSFLPTRRATGPPGGSTGWCAS
ncbi:hypothetical protein PR202_ga28775 [Eleusine coracana subsp. coracana]|uniref:RNase H type-1 domain-containing protein n=1 Tax=Eleusine coracana subsp. coracana TaxID=191504 RepID=A0AAV5DKL8_ELECO|nr:hypothetical protein PR202_ga28775 [Eleusine coracana subsp. coracana]